MATIARKPTTRQAAQPQTPSESTIESARQAAMCIALMVRYELEGFHVAHLSDEQMAELNPLIRNAIFTGLYAFMTAEDDEASSAYIAYHEGGVPRYWEQPELTEDYLAVVEMIKRKRRHDA